MIKPDLENLFQQYLDVLEELKFCKDVERIQTLSKKGLKLNKKIEEAIGSKNAK